jgi:uncharacterized protein YndB with AHSA1/START domain
MAQTGTDTLVLETRIEARPETVFPFLTDPERMTRWMGRSATLDPRPGGVFLVDVTGKHVARGEFVSVDPPRRVVFTWGWEDHPELPPGASTVEIELVPDGEGTIVRLSHRGLPGETVDAHRHGWNHYLERLTAVAVGRDPGPDPMASES